MINERQKIKETIEKDIRVKFSVIPVLEDTEIEEYRYLNEYIDFIRFDGASIKIFMNIVDYGVTLKELKTLNAMFDGELELLLSNNTVFILWDDRQKKNLLRRKNK